MHLPKRARGLILGFTIMVAGPMASVLLTTPAPAAPAAVRSNPTVVVQLVAQTINQPHMLRARGPIPPPAPPAPKPPTHPAPAFVIPQYSGSQAQVVAIILAAAARYGVSGSWMVSIASCESGLRPTALNTHGPYYGLFQFLMSTFVHNGGTNIWDPTDQANIAAKMLAHGQAYQWSCA